MDLQEWTVHFVKYKDTIARKLESYKTLNNWIVFTFKDKEHWYLIEEELNQAALEKIKERPFRTIVCSYTQSNLDFVLRHWEKLSQMKNFWILFADPSQEKKFLLSPHTHNFVADPESLKAGLQALFEPERAGAIPEKKSKKRKDEDWEEEQEEA